MWITSRMHRSLTFTMASSHSSSHHITAQSRQKKDYVNIAFLTHRKIPVREAPRTEQCASLLSALVQKAHPDIRSALEAPPRGKTLLEAQAHHEPPSGITNAKGGYSGLPLNACPS